MTAVLRIVADTPLGGSVAGSPSVTAAEPLAVQVPTPHPPGNIFHSVYLDMYVYMKGILPRGGGVQLRVMSGAAHQLERAVVGVVSLPMAVLRPQTGGASRSRSQLADFSVPC